MENPSAEVPENVNSENSVKIESDDDQFEKVLKMGLEMEELQNGAPENLVPENVEREKKVKFEETAEIDIIEDFFANPPVDPVQLDLAAMSSSIMNLTDQDLGLCGRMCRVRNHNLMRSDFFHGNNWRAHLMALYYFLTFQWHKISMVYNPTE